MEEELIHFLENIGLGQCVDKFSEEEVTTMNTLMILSDSHISSLLPKIGHQAILKDAIQKLKNANLKRMITTASKLMLNKNSENMRTRLHDYLPGPSLTAFKKYSASPQPDISPHESYHSGINCDVLECISMNRMGRAILNSYEQNNYLLPSQRKHLVHIVVEHLMQQSTRLLSQHFQLAASSIVRIFPSEAIETYFTPSSGTNGKHYATGLLPTRYKNQRTLLISQGIFSKNTAKESYETFLNEDCVDPVILNPKMEEIEDEDQVKIEEEPLVVIEEPWNDDSSPHRGSPNNSLSLTHDQMSQWSSSKHTQSDLDSISAVNAFIGNGTSLGDSEFIHNSFPGPSSSFKRFADSASADASPPKRFCSDETTVNCDVLKAIRMSSTGRVILKSYEQNNFLLPTQRKHLVHIVVEHLMQQSTRLLGQHFQIAASNIVKLFPTEAPETYFIPCSETAGKSAAGMLPTRYKNRRTFLINQGIISKSTSKERSRTTSTNDGIESSFLTSSKMEDAGNPLTEKEPLVGIEQEWSDDSVSDVLSLGDQLRTNSASSRTSLESSEFGRQNTHSRTAEFKPNGVPDSVQDNESTGRSDETTVNCDVLRTISGKSTGRAILKSYEQNNYLLPSQRKRLVHIVVDHLMQQSTRLLGQHFQVAASNIVRVFPTEAVETYFIPCSDSSGRAAAGMLPVRYRNRRTVLISQGIISKSTKRDKSKTSLSEDSLDLPMGTPELRDAMMMKASSPGEVGNRWKDTSNPSQEDSPQKSHSSHQEVDLRLASGDSSNYLHKRSSCNFKENGIPNSPPGTSSSLTQAPSESHRPVSASTDLCYSGVNCDVLRAISGKSTGRAILESYEQNNYLLPTQRKRLVHIVVDHLMQQSTRLLGQHFHISASNIVKVFPTEAVDTYFIPCSRAAGKTASGMLCSRYKNQRNTLISQGIISKSSSKDGCKTSSGNVNIEPLPLTPVVQQAVDFLKGNLAEPWEEIEKAWAESFSFRLNTFSASSRHASARDRMEEWPPLKHPQGFRLINMDFEREHPNKSHCLFSKWFKVYEAYKDYILAEAAMKRNSAIPLLIESMTNEDGRNVVLFKLMHSSCPPVLIRLKDKKIWHPSVADSEKSFFLHLKDFSSLESVVSNLKEELMGKTTNPNFPPFIVGVGENLNALTSFLVHVGGVNYRFDSFLEAVDCCFKIYMVFRLKYPDCSAIFWNFIQKGFYNITTEYECQNSSISALISVLNL